MKIVGEDGRYQNILIWGFLIPLTILIPWTALVPVFQASVPDHWCRLPSKPNGTSLEEWKELHIPM